MLQSRLTAITVIDDPLGPVASVRRGRLRRHAFRYRGRLTAVAAIAFFCWGHFAGAVQKGDKVLSADKVVAQMFELTGPNGKPTARLFSTDSGSAMLAFLDEKLAPRLILGLVAHGQPSLVLRDAKGDSRVDIHADAENGTPSIMLLDKAQSDATVLLTTSAGGPRLTFSESEGGRLGVGLNSEGQPTVKLQGSGGERGIYLSAARDGPMISVMGTNTKQRADWKLDDDGRPTVFVRDVRGAVTLLSSLDQDGKPTTQRFGR